MRTPTPTPVLPGPPAPRALRRLHALAFGVALGLAAVGVSAGCASLDEPPAGAPVRYADGGDMGDAGYFYDALSPYGRWVELSPYGLVWLPDGLGPSWSPYSQGFWAYSDYGWTWVDAEPWGWAPFHYGRWWLDPQYAWVWIPGSEWAPAWVAWRQSEAYVAWAPLPPTVHWSFTVPLHSGGSSVDALPSAWWNVARPADLADASLSRRLVASADKLTALARTEDRTRITVRDDHPYNEGVSVNWVESRLGRPLTRYRVIDAPAAGGTRSGVVDGSAVSLFRPDLTQLSHRGIGRPANRQRPPEAGVVPARGADDTSPGVLPRGRAQAPADSLKLETFLAGERNRMLAEQADERKAATDDELDALAERHAREARAFEAYAARVRKQGRLTVLHPPAHFDRMKSDGGRAPAPAVESDSTRAR